jgi:hypothetical protein
MRSTWWRVLVLIVMAVTPLAIVLLASSDAQAQCSMCRAALTSATNTKFVRNFNIGVLVLFVPPVAIFCSIFIALKRHRGNG